MPVSPAAARDALAACVALDGYGRVRAQPASDWTGEATLPDALAAFYRDVGPDGVTAEMPGNALYFPSLADLWQRQAGYRWDGRTGARVEDWDDRWIVVADQGGDPFVFDAASQAVLFASHGAGTWDFGEAFPDLPTFAFVAGTLGRVRLEFGLAFFDEDFNVTDEALAAGRAALRPHAADEREVEEWLSTLGWAY